MQFRVGNGVLSEIPFIGDTLMAISLKLSWKTPSFSSETLSSSLEYPDFHLRPQAYDRRPTQFFNGDFLSETPEMSSETPAFHHRPPNFHRRHNIVMGNPNLFIGDPKIFIGDPYVFIKDPINNRSPIKR